MRRRLGCKVHLHDCGWMWPVSWSANGIQLMEGMALNTTIPMIPVHCGEGAQIRCVQLENMQSLIVKWCELQMVGSEVSSLLSAVCVTSVSVCWIFLTLLLWSPSLLYTGLFRLFLITERYFPTLVHFHSSSARQILFCDHSLLSVFSLFFCL